MSITQSGLVALQQLLQPHARLMFSVDVRLLCCYLHTPNIPALSVPLHVLDWVPLPNFSDPNFKLDSTRTIDH